MATGIVECRSRNGFHRLMRTVTKNSYDIVGIYYYSTRFKHINVILYDCYTGRMMEKTCKSIDDLKSDPSIEKMRMRQFVSTDDNFDMNIRIAIGKLVANRVTLPLELIEKDEMKKNITHAILKGVGLNSNIMPNTGYSIINQVIMAVTGKDPSRVKHTISSSSVDSSHLGPGTYYSSPLTLSQSSARVPLSTALSREMSVFFDCCRELITSNPLFETRVLSMANLKEITEDEKEELTFIASVLSSDDSRINDTDAKTIDLMPQFDMIVSPPPIPLTPLPSPLISSSSPIAPLSSPLPPSIPLTPSFSSSIPLTPSSSISLAPSLSSQLDPSRLSSSSISLAPSLSSQLDLSHLSSSIPSPSPIEDAPITIKSRNQVWLKGDYTSDEIMSTLIDQQNRLLEAIISMDAASIHGLTCEINSFRREIGKDEAKVTESLVSLQKARTGIFNIQEQMNSIVRTMDSGTPTLFNLSSFISNLDMASVSLNMEKMDEAHTKLVDGSYPSIINVGTSMDDNVSINLKSGSNIILTSMNSNVGHLDIETLKEALHYLDGLDNHEKRFNVLKTTITRELATRRNL
jgi:hypothetical protein